MKYFYFVFYSKKKSIKFRLSLINLVLLSVLFGCLCFFSFFFLLNKSELLKQKNEYSELYLKEKEEIESIKSHLDEVSEFYDDYYDNVTNYSASYFKKLNDKNMNQISNDFKPLFQEMGINDNSEVLDWSQKTYSVKLFLKKIENFKEIKKKFLEIIPNGWPVKDKIGYITSVYGPRISPFDNKLRMHEGLDIAAPIGTPLKAMADGIVLFSGIKKGYGKVIAVRHEYGYTSLYAHCHKLLKPVNKKVKKGEIIAELGNTGKSTAPHLHLEIRIGNKIVNPWVYISTDE